MNSPKDNIIFFDDEYEVRKKVLKSFLKENFYEFVRVDYITNESLKKGEVGAAIDPIELVDRYCNHGNHCFFIVDLALIHQSRDIKGGIELLKNFKNALGDQWGNKKFNERVAIISNHTRDEVGQIRLTIDTDLGIDFEKAFFFWGDLRKNNEAQERFVELVRNSSCK